MARSKKPTAQEGGEEHPLSHVDSLRAYEWMLAECAALNANRQARQDSIISTVTQISSAALLAIPGLFFAKDSRFPEFRHDPFLYVGLLLFLGALAAAMAEQHFSAVAHEKQIEICQAYYTKQSSTKEDVQSRRHVQWVRRGAYFLFGTALLVSSLALLLI
jgi:hypothetical protein